MSDKITSTEAFKKATGTDMIRLRVELRLNQREWAKFLGLPSGTIATWERRKDRELSGPANIIYHLAENRTREVRQNLQRCLDELKASLGS
jgi:DNA-binding transcriptional regulator YiaG